MDFTTILQQAWTRLRRHRGLLILCTIITAIPGMIDRGIEQWFYTIPGAWMMVSSSSLEATEQVLVAPYDWSYNLVMIVTLILGSWLWIGYIQAILTITDDQKPILEQLFGAKAITVARYLGASFLYLCGIGLGLLLFIIPGIWLALRWHLYNYYIAQGYGVIDSLKASWNVTRGSISKIMGIGCAMVLGYILIFSVWVALAIVIFQQINIPISDTSMIDISRIADALMSLSPWMVAGMVCFLLVFTLVGLWLINTLGTLSFAHIYKTLKPNTPESIKPIE